MFKGIEVQILNVKGSFVSMRYKSSNAKSRMKKKDFIESFENGTFDVSNPEALPEEIQEVVKE